MESSTLIFPPINLLLPFPPVMVYLSNSGLSLAILLPSVRVSCRILHGIHKYLSTKIFMENR